MNLSPSRAQRISQKNIRILEATSSEMVPEHDDPSIKHEFNVKICPDCGVPFVKNQNRGALTGDIDEKRFPIEDSFTMVCPKCGCTPY